MASQLPGELDAVLSAIKADAPSARVVVLDYPDLYDLSRSSWCIGLSTTDRTDLNNGANELDSQIQAAAARHGDVFADVRSAFSGHEICDSSSWLHSVNFLDISESYHPTASGQSGAYEPVFSATRADRTELQPARAAGCPPPARAVRITRSVWAALREHRRPPGCGSRSGRPDRPAAANSAELTTAAPPGSLLK